MRKADNLPPSCAVITKSGSPNFLEPSGPVQACNGTALPFNTLYVSDGLSVRHQELKTVHTATGICQTDTAVCLLAGTRRNCSSISFYYRNSFIIVFLFCMFVFYYVCSVFLYCFSFCIRLYLSYFCTSLSTTAIG